MPAPVPQHPMHYEVWHMIPNLPICIRRAQTRLCGWADWGICHNTEVSHSLCACSSSSCMISMCIAQISTWLDKLWALSVIFCQYTLLSRPLVPRYRRQRSTSAPSGPILANTTLTVIRFFGTRYLYKGNFLYQSISLWLDQHHPSIVPIFPLHWFRHHVERNLEVRLWLASFPRPHSHASTLIHSQSTSQPFNDYKEPTYLDVRCRGYREHWLCIGIRALNDRECYCTWATWSPEQHTIPRTRGTCSRSWFRVSVRLFPETMHYAICTVLSL